MEKLDFNISFPEVNFDLYLSDTIPFPKVLRAQLIVESDNIELVIFDLNIDNYLFKFNRWISEINSSDFGKYISVSNENQNEDVLKIEFIESMWISVKPSRDNKLISISLDSIKIHKYINLVQNNASIYLCNNGFHFIKHFYSFFWLSNDTFKQDKRYDKPFKGYNCQINPVFIYDFKDDKNSKELNINKIPIFHFEFLKNETFETATKNINSILSVCSFFFQNKIEYYKSIIHIGNTRIIKYRILDKTIKKRDKSFKDFGINWTETEFLSKDWKENAYNNYPKLHNVIELFNKSLHLDERSKLMIRYSIIEICMGGNKKLNLKFTLSNKKETFNKIIDTFILNLPQEEHMDFKNKWNTISDKILTKPLKSPLKEFLVQNNIPDNLPITIESIKKLRDDITHGSIDIDEKNLYYSNLLLYRISGILILNILGINEWKFNYKLPK